MRHWQAVKYLIVLVVLVAATAAHAESHWRLSTDRGRVHAWVPDHYDAATAVTVVFVHGYKTDVDRAWSGYKLPEQFARSGLNAMFIACGAPRSLAHRVRWPSLAELLRVVGEGVDVEMPAGGTVAVGHSAAYRTLVHWLPSASLDTLVLLDAAYGEEDRFLKWTRGNLRHRLINIASDTRQESNWMHRSLPDTKRVYGLHGEWSDDVRTSRVIYVRTRVGHIPMIEDGVALPLALSAVASRPADAEPIE
jgi:hypothetical protein